MSKQENLEAAKKAQHELDISSQKILTESLEANRKLRPKLKHLQDEMDQDIPK